MKYLDFHVHSNLSDGVHSVQDLMEQAQKCGIDLMAITDHNYTMDLQQLKKDYPHITLIQGSEVSCKYKASNKEEQELHVVALGFNPENEKMKKVLAKNQPDRRPYLNRILARLAECGIHIGTYEELVKDYPESKHVGRCQIAMKMKRLGYVETSEEAFDKYIGEFGERRAYVKSPLDYISLEECIDAILDANGIAILAHLYYYRLDDEGNRKLLQYFKELTGEQGGMETDYLRYTEEQRTYLRMLADTYGLLHSAGSDYHGKEEGEVLEGNFLCSDFQPLIRKLL